MFLEESNKYYKKKERYDEFRKYHGLIIKAIFIFSFLSIVLYFLPSYSGSKLNGENDSSTSMKESAFFSDEFYENLFADKSYVLSTEEDRKQCIKEGTEWLKNTCRNQCEKEKKNFPRPLVHNACVDGCKKGGSKTVESECNKDYDLLKLMKNTTCQMVHQELQ